MIGDPNEQLEADLNDLAIYAFRYALGRMTYAPDEVANILIQNSDILSKRVRDLISTEIIKAINENGAGTEMDSELWSTVLLAFEEVGNEQR